MPVLGMARTLQRAIQIDPSFTYAYTLSGHEYVSNEDFEKVRKKGKKEKRKKER